MCNDYEQHIAWAEYCRMMASLALKVPSQETNCQVHLRGCSPDIPQLQPSSVGAQHRTATCAILATSRYIVLSTSSIAAFNCR